MKIVADDRIPFLRGIWEKFAEVRYIPGKQIAHEDLIDADALIVRTRTGCSRELLTGTAVRCVATATIGFDHIDAPALADLGIPWSNAPGCNARSVMDYIASAFAASGADLRGRVLGVVGVGNVGKLVAQAGAAFGMKVLLNDPPRAEREGSAGFVSLDELLAESDVVTLHVPLERGGRYPTVNLADETFFDRMKPGAWFFNSCRGEAVDPEAFLAAKKRKKVAFALMDVWPGEPDIAPELLENVELATPHIAGYSVDGKANGTAAAVRFSARMLKVAELQEFRVVELPEPVYPSRIEIPDGMDAGETLRYAVLHAYDIRKDTEMLRNSPGEFESLRGNYWKRREFSAYTVANAPETAWESLQILGFNIEKGR